MAIMEAVVLAPCEVLDLLLSNVVRQGMYSAINKPDSNTAVSVV